MRALIHARDVLAEQLVAAVNASRSQPRKTAWSFRVTLTKYECRSLLRHRGRRISKQLGFR